MDINFTVAGGLHDSFFGKCLDPLKMIITSESDLLDKQLHLVDGLFEVEKSTHYGETYELRAGLDDFMAIEEGGLPVNDGTESTGKKVIENIEFGKRLTFTRRSIDDAKGKITGDNLRDTKDFISAYYRTRNRIASAALTNGEKQSIIINNAVIDLTCADKNPLFCKTHKWGGKKNSGKQCNLFYLADGADAIKSVEYMEDVLDAASSKILNMKNEDGNVMGYAGDTIRIPGNRRQLAKYIRKVLGSEYAGSIENATLNTQNGKFNIFVDPFWQADKDVIDVMSKECSKNIGGNIFQNRVKLDVKMQEKDFNLESLAYCRFGVGFPQYKHIVRVYLLDKDATMATAELLD